MYFSALAILMCNKVQFKHSLTAGQSSTSFKIKLFSILDNREQVLFKSTLWERAFSQLFILRSENNAAAFVSFSEFGNFLISLPNHFVVFKNPFFGSFMFLIKLILDYLFELKNFFIFFPDYRIFVTDDGIQFRFTLRDVPQCFHKICWNLSSTVSKQFNSFFRNL